jgi:hypothetical protein
VSKGLRGKNSRSQTCKGLEFYWPRGTGIEIQKPKDKKDDRTKTQKRKNSNNTSITMAYFAYIKVDNYIKVILKLI